MPITKTQINKAIRTLKFDPKDPMNKVIIDADNLHYYTNRGLETLTGIKQNLQAPNGSLLDGVNELLKLGLIMKIKLENPDD